MIYRVQLFKFFSAMGDHTYRIKKAEKITNIWKTSILLILATAVIYGWMAYLGIGANLISSTAPLLSAVEYESSKLWFMLGRIVYGIVFAAIILFIPSLLFYALTEIPYQKIVIMQQVTLSIILLERVIWVPLAVFVGLDWYTSPLSMGIIASYLIEVEWFIYFFGAISLFQIWIIGFQFQFLHRLSNVKRSRLIIVVILMHVLGWAIAATLALTDFYFISRWFG